MARKTAGQAGDSWDKEGELHGIYVERKQNVGRHQSNVYVVEQADGTRLSVWGSTVLDGRFQEIPINSEVWITCLGEKSGKGGSTYVDYQVDYDDEFPLAEAQDAKNAAAAVGGTPATDAEAAAAKRAFN